jgi:PAS domain S-box-containing protein
MTAENKPTLGKLTEEQRFQLLVAGVSDYAIYMLDPGGYVSSWNAGAHRFKGYLAHEIIGKHFSTFYTEEDRAAGVPSRALRTALTEGKFEAEGWRVRKDGSQFWASVVIDPIRTEAGELVGFAKVTRDITERKLAQEALRESEERFRLLVQGVTNYAIYMLSPTGIITNWNAGAERIKGYTHDEAVGQHFSRFYTEEDRIANAPSRGLGIAAKVGRYENEGWRVRKDGTRFWAHVVVDAIHDDNGTLIGFAKVTRDITEKKDAAEALKRADAALFQSQKMEAIGQLTGGIAHDFNNLLSVMSSSLDLLSSRLRDEQDVRLIDSMQRAVTRGANLTQQLLSFARQQPLKVERLDINSVIGGFESVLRRACNTSITFEMDLQSELVPVMLDEARFEAALLNLVVNARDAMQSGGQLTVRTENIALADGQAGSLKAGRYVKLTVVDTGTGMSRETASRAFEPFFTTKEVGKGTGLGLSQVYGFIAQSGGEVILASELGKGTSVSIYLPASESESTSPTASRNDRPARDTVLIVEDEPDLMRAAADLFRALGFEVLTAGEGKDAIDILERTDNIGLVFTDVIMPNGMSGIELARQTRRRWPKIKSILASGYPLPALKAEHGNIDDFPFVSKPYRLSDIARKLRTLG